MKKGKLDPATLWPSGDEVIAGEIRSIGPERPYLTGTPHAVVGYRDPSPKTRRIRIYGPSESEGRCTGRRSARRQPTSRRLHRLREA